MSPAVLTWLKDTFERVASSFVEALITFALVAGTLDLSVEGVLKSGAVLAAIVALKQAVFAVSPGVTGNWFLDTASRAGWSAVQAALTVAAVDGFDFADGSAWRAAAAAGIMAALTIIKSAIASRRTGTITPASLAKAA